MEPLLARSKIRKGRNLDKKTELTCLASTEVISSLSLSWTCRCFAKRYDVKVSDVLDVSNLRHESLLLSHQGQIWHL